MVPTRRPFGVSFAAGWAAISAFLNLLTAMGAGILGVGGATAYPGAAVVALLLAAFQFLLGMSMLILAGGLYKVQSWARLAGIVLFGTFAVLNLTSVLRGDIAGLVPLGLNVTALFLLTVNREAFASTRPDVSGGSASSYRPGR